MGKDRMIQGIVAWVAPMLFVGCALTTETIHIDYPAPIQVAKVEGAERIRIKLEVIDLRAKQDKEVARKINGFGSEMAPILNDEDPLALVRRAFETELKARGYLLDEGKVPVRVELVAFLHKYNSGFFSGDSEATVTFVTRVKDAEGRELWSDTSSDSFKHAAGVFTGGNVKQAYEQALPGAVHKLMAKPEFHAAIAKAAAPPAAPAPAPATPQAP